MKKNAPFEPLLGTGKHSLQVKTALSYASDPDCYAVKTLQTNKRLLSNGNPKVKYQTFGNQNPRSTHAHLYDDRLIDDTDHPRSPNITHVRRSMRRNIKQAQRLKSRKFARLNKLQNLNSMWISELIKLDDQTEKEVHVYCCCKSYDFHKISESFSDRMFCIFACYEDALHFRYTHNHERTMAMNVVNLNDHEYNLEPNSGSDGPGLQDIVNDKDIFVFQIEGVVVFWNVSKSHRERFVQLLRAYQTDYPIEELSKMILPHRDEYCYELGMIFGVENQTVSLSLISCFDPNLIENWDDCVEEYVTDSAYVQQLDLNITDEQFKHHKSPPMRHRDHEMHLHDTDGDMEHDHVDSHSEMDQFIVEPMVNWKAVRGLLMMQKLSVSFALAQGSKLTIFEERVDENIELNADISYTLATKGRLTLKSDMIAKRMGRLFIARAELNLRSDVLDTPEHFYSNDVFLREFTKLRQYQNVDKRLEVINSRFALLHELYEIVIHQMETAHNSKLEWIVIWLIVIEVVIGLCELVLLYYNPDA